DCRAAWRSRRPCAPPSPAGSRHGRAPRRWAVRSRRLRCRGGSRFLGRGTRRVEAGLRTDEPLLAATRERLAALPEAERLLECRCPLLESGDDLHQLVARLFVAEGGDVGPVLVGPGLVRTGGVGHALQLTQPSPRARRERPGCAEPRPR